MRVCEILSRERVLLARPGLLRERSQVIDGLAEMLAPAAGLSASHIVEELNAREELQSTAVGSGVAVPHARFDSIGQQFGALIISAKGIEFGAIDGGPVQIFLGVIGPQGQIKRHLQLLTAISRLLRDVQIRRRLIESPDIDGAFALLEAAEAQ